MLRWVDPIDSSDLDNGPGTILTTYALSFQLLFPGFEPCLGMLYFNPNILWKLGEMSSLEPPFWPYMAFRVNGRQWASLPNNQFPPSCPATAPVPVKFPEMQRGKLRQIYLVYFYIWSYLYLYLNRCICTWIKAEQNICICISKLQFFCINLYLYLLGVKRFIIFRCIGKFELTIHIMIHSRKWQYNKIQFYLLL